MPTSALRISCLSIFSGLAFLTAVSVPDAHAAVTLAPTEFSRVPGWGQDRHDQALKSLFHSCEAVTRQPKGLKIAGQKSVSSAAWQSLCYQALALKHTPWRAKNFFEEYFLPYRLIEHGATEGKLTGYYAPVLQGSLTRQGIYQYPVYAVPSDLRQGTPYLSRAEIDQGALNGRGLELMYLSDPVMRYFLQVQGSGIVRMNDGSNMRLSYAGDNGLTYVAIGKELIRRGVLEKHEVSLNAIRNWLNAHPDQADAILQTNPRYIFFKADRHGEAFGAQGVPLTPERSLAVDPSYIPYGLPIFVSTTLGVSGRPFDRLMVAQDTGSAIRGAIRGDIYFGIGEEAERMAGPMNNDGQFTLLIPHE